jgi:hypothetical protein
MRLQLIFRRWLALVLAAALLAGCGAARLAYNNGETVAYWWLNNYIDVDSGQQALVKRHLQNLFAWHRKTQLDDYAQILGQARQQLHRNVTPAEALAYVDVFRKRSLVVLDRALPELTDLALSLEPQQIDHLEKKFASNNEKYRKDYLRGDLERRQRHRFKDIMKQGEYWLGDFSDEQEAQLRQISDARPMNNELVLESRMRRQEEMIALLRQIQSQKPPREAVARMIRDYASAAQNYFGNQQHKTFFDSYREATARLSASMVNMATPQQKTHADRRIQQWIDDCHTLSGRG